MKILEQIQKVGNGPRVCLLNRKLINAGFEIGAKIKVTESDTGEIIVTLDDNGKKKVSRVMNHGKVLPVIDIKATKSIPLKRFKSQAKIIITSGKISISPIK